MKDEGERGTELFVLDNRGLRDLASFVEGPICRFDAAVEGFPADRRDNPQ